ncbi:MAG: HAD-IA family hydrolase [Desulfotomaculaceae bacterium]|nr:HAD-IA family hydrolase [Desulfotomaculaceae bacterium]
MHITTVLFDLDGTLVDTLPLIVQTLRKVFSDMKIPWGDDDVNVMKLIGYPLADIGEHFAGEKKAHFIELYLHYYEIEHDRMTRLYPGTLEILKYLKSRDLKLGIVTSKGRPVTLRTVAYTGLERFMDVIVTAHDVLKHKPDPEPLMKALDMLKASVEQTIFVGDSRFDILTGQKAGTLNLGVTWGLASRKELELLKADGLLDEWIEIKKYL